MGSRHICVSRPRPVARVYFAGACFSCQRGRESEQRADAPNSTTHRPLLLRLIVRVFCGMSPAERWIKLSFAKLAEFLAAATQVGPIIVLPAGGCRPQLRQQVMMQAAQLKSPFGSACACPDGQCSYTCFIVEFRRSCSHSSEPASPRYV